MKSLAEINTESTGSRQGLARPTKWQMVLSTTGLAAVGIAQPLLDLLGRNPDFFIARAAPGSDVMLLGILLGTAIPLALGILVLFAYLIRPVIGSAFHVLILAVSGALIANSVIRLSPIDEQPWVVAVGIGLLSGALLSWSYYRIEWTRSFLNMMAVAPLVVTVVFLFFSQTSEAAWGMGPATGSQSAPVRNPAPLVMLVFDEFPIASVIDTDGQIQGDYFPALAELSNDATWFRNAVSTQQATRDAIPALLTGISQVPGEKLPHYADHPSSIFTMVGNDYEVNAIETLTQMCPEVVCSKGSREVGDFGERWASLLADLSVVAGHLLLPTSLSGDLPPIDQNWGNFAPEVERPDKWAVRDMMQDQLEADRRTGVDRFLAGLDEPLKSREFHFYHLPLPHRPWMYGPNGRTYASGRGHPGAERGGWGPNGFLVEQAYQRHLIQTQYADSIIGSVVSRLKESGSYDASIVVVTADHGVAVRPGQHPRSIRDETVGDIAAIPFFIKAPHQSRGVVDDYRATVTDIVPTIAGLVDAEIPWAADGIDLFGSTRPERLESTMMGQARSITFGADGNEKFEVVSYHSAYFGDRGPFGLAPLGYAELLGENVGRASDAEDIVTAELDFPELYTEVDPESGPLPIRLSGTLDGALSSSGVLAVTVDSRIVVLTESWNDNGTFRFQAMLPPSILKPGENEFGLYTVHRDGDDYSYLWVEQH